jgi:hypothetical protein
MWTEAAAGSWLGLARSGLRRSCTLDMASGAVMAAGFLALEVRPVVGLVPGGLCRPAACCGAAATSSALAAAGDADLAFPGAAAGIAPAAAPCGGAGVSCGAWVLLLRLSEYLLCSDEPWPLPAAVTCRSAAERPLLRWTEALGADLDLLTGLAGIGDACLASGVAARRAG